MKIKLDFDSKGIDFEEMNKKIRYLMVLLQIQKVEVDIKETVKGFHVYINTMGFNLKPKDILICQLILGSDRNREMFNYGRILNNEDNWNILFFEKREDNKIISKERDYERYTLEVEKCQD